MLTEIKTETAHYFEDEHGNIQGEYKEYHVRGHLLETGNFVDGNRHGECVQWWPDGNMKSKRTHVHNQLEGTYFAWHNNGQMDTVRRYLNDRLHGQLDAWDEHGNRTVSCMYEHGRMVGEYRRWRPDGTIDTILFCTATREYVTNLVINEIADMDNVTDEEKAIIMIKWGIKCLDLSV